MNIFDYAMQMEKEGESLYREFAKASPEKGLAYIFTELAGQESKHYEIFKKMKEGGNAGLSETPFLDNVKSVFENWKQSKDKCSFKISQAELYKKALDIEQKSVDFYRDKSNEVNESEQKDIFLRIAKEEQNHFEIIESIIEFITKPERWVEHAEFSKIGEEY